MLNDNAKSSLLLPPQQLASCIAAGVFRDTRNADLSDMDRFNYFPASPLVAVTYIVEGDIRIVEEAGNLDDAKGAKPIAQQSVIQKQDEPIVSWSTGSVAALTVGFYPDAWQRLGYSFDDHVIPAALASALSSFGEDKDPTQCWVKFGQAVSGHWKNARVNADGSGWSGSDRLADWSRYQLSRLALGNSGRSIRTLERQIKRMSGQTKQSLNFYSAIEDLHRLTVTSPEDSLADIAVEAGFADQSHMGRAVRRATGFPPAKLNHLIETEEAFWCYRLLRQRF